jgi:hypothetical protein
MQGKIHPNADPLANAEWAIAGIVNLLTGPEAVNVVC